MSTFGWILQEQDILILEEYTLLGVIADRCSQIIPDGVQKNVYDEDWKLYKGRAAESRAYTGGICNSFRVRLALYPGIGAGKRNCST